MNLGSCRDGMRLQPGEGCSYTSGGTLRANVVLSVTQDGAICREGGPAKQVVGDVTLNIDHLRLCSTDGFEVDDAFESDILAKANADGTWTFYQSSRTAVRASATTAPTAEPTAIPTPEPTATAATPPSQPGKISEFDGGGARKWREMHENGQVVACQQGLVLPRDSFCLDPNFRFSPDYSELLNTKYLVAHLPDGQGLVLAGSSRFQAGGNIELGDLTFEKVGATRVITRLETSANAPGPAADRTQQPTPAADLAADDEVCRVGLQLSPGDECSYESFSIRIREDGAAVLDGNIDGIRMGNTVMNAQSINLNRLSATRSGSTWTIEGLP